MMNKIPELAWHKLHRFEELDDDMKQAIIRLVNYLATHKHGEDEMIVPMLKQIDSLLNPKQTLN